MSDFPMFKLATQLARQLSSPIATAIKNYARSHPGMSRWVCMAVARRFKTTELRVKLRLISAARGPARAPAVHTMSDQDAINTGADILGEIILFTLGAAIITFEVNRQAEIQEGMKLDKRSRWVAVLLSLEELQKELVLQQQELEQMSEALQAIVQRRREELSQNQEQKQ